MNLNIKSYQSLLSKLESSKLQWTAGSLIKKDRGKRFDHTESIVKIVDTDNYFFRVFPPRELATLMQKPPPDIFQHLKTHDKVKRKPDKVNTEPDYQFVSFIAKVSYPNTDSSNVEITLKSEQRYNGGVYAQETNMPHRMICVCEFPSDTVLVSLNNVLFDNHWFPHY